LCLRLAVSSTFNATLMLTCPAALVQSTTPIHQVSLALIRGCRRNYGLSSKVRPGGVIVRAVDLRFRRSRVRLRALRFQVTTLGKLFTHIWSFMPLTVILVIISFRSSTLFFIPDLKPSFSANPSHCSFLFLLQDWLHDSPYFYCYRYFWAYPFFAV